MPHTAAAPKDVEDTDFPGQPDQLGDSVVILVKRKGPENEIAAFHKANGGKVTKFKHIKWDAVEIPKGQAAKILKKYKESTLFENVEFQRTYSVDATPNDPLFNQQWDLPKIEAQAAWDKATSNNVVVAVIDTGIDFNHPDLVQNLWTGPQGEHGYTAVNGTITAGGMDDHFHGTHVAGTIAAVGNNGVGVVGINWRAKVAAFKFLGASGSGSTRDAVLCIEKMIDLKQAGHNIRVSNNSWGAPIPSDLPLEDAFREAQNNGIINICAAGNNGFDIDQFGGVPAGIPLDGIVSILASDQNDVKPAFSNYGVVGTDLLAPGVGILNCKLNGGYWLLSGTSMASPHVAGAVAMVFAFNPNLTVDQMRTILLQPESYDKTSFTANTTGGGRLNLRKFWNNPTIGNPSPPNHAPTLTVNTSTNFLTVPIGKPTTIMATATDPDGDTLAYNTTATAFKDNWWPDVWWERPHFAFNQPTNITTVTTLPLALDQRVKMRFSVSDGHGGGRSLDQTVWSFRDESKVRDMQAGIVSFTNWFTGGKYWFRLNVNTNIVRADSKFTVEVRPQSSPWGWEGEVNKDIETQMQFPNAGAYTARPMIIDTDGNMTTGPRAQIIVSNATERAPEIHMTLNTRRGVAPLEIVADMSATTKGTSSQLQFGALEWRKGGVNTDIFNPVRRFTLTEPGVYEIQFYAGATGTQMSDAVVEFITVLPFSPTPPPPRLTIIRSGNGVRVSWTENGVLQETANVNGPWTDSSNQSNPQNRSTTGVKQFFRMR